jgi:hypothetical protein
MINHHLPSQLKGGSGIALERQSPSKEPTLDEVERGSNNTSHRPDPEEDNLS